MRASPTAYPRISDAQYPPQWGRTGRLVVVPARDEAERIEACIASIQSQEADVLVVANNCSDATFSLAAQAGAAVFDCTVPFGGVGTARRLGVSEGLRHSDDVQAILTTDADCTVAPDWIDANLRHLDAGAAAVCGWVLPIPEEHAALPAALRRRAALEDRFLELKALLELQLTGKEGHEQTPGASLAFRPAAYAKAGGFDQMPTHEDRAIILRFKELGLPVVHSKDVNVYASCRLEGRAPGGMAAALRERAEDRDAPLCTDMGKSDSPEMRQILMGLGPLNTQFDLPAAIATLERLMGLDGREKSDAER